MSAVPPRPHPALRAGWREGDPCYIIAEAGVNHDGDVDKAFKLADAAKRAGADAVKYQSFTAQNLLRADAMKPSYQRRTTPEGETQYAMLQRLELPAKTEIELASYCHDLGIDFLSTPYDVEALHRLVDLSVPALKIASCDLTFLPLVRAAAATGLPTILSTGAAELDEIAASKAQFRAAGGGHLVLLQCTTAYPCPPASIHLRAMASLAAIDPAVGFSDHSTGTDIAMAARALGARVLEKHFTLDPSAPGPDHSASLDPNALARFVRGIRDVEEALGSGEKRVQPIEYDTRRLMRRSVVVLRDLPAGSVVRAEDIGCKRPGTHASPMLWDDLIGRRLRVPLRQDEPLLPEHLEARPG